MIRFFLLLVVTLCCWTQSVRSQELPESLKAKVDAMITAELDKGAFPGASVAIGTRNGIFYLKSYGYHDYSKRLPVRNDDVFDVASCTKVLSTTFAAMRLFDQGRLRIEDSIGHYLPELVGSPISGITLEELLTHTSGMPAQVLYSPFVHNADGGNMFSSKKSDEYPYQVGKNYFVCRNVAFDTTYFSETPRDGWRQGCDRLFINPAIDTVLYAQIFEAFKPENRGKYAYSDSNLWILKQIVERVSGETLDRMTRDLFAEMGCKNTYYNPLRYRSKDRCMPTEVDHVLKRDTVNGYVHDELAVMAGGVGGNAGLFTTAEDMSRFCEMILNGGVYNGKRILSENTVGLFTASPLEDKGIWRGLGFDKRDPVNSGLGGKNCFGHTGFTGTIFWMDADRGIYMVFLSNAVHPTRLNNRLNSSMLRTELWKVVSQ